MFIKTPCQAWVWKVIIDSTTYKDVGESGTKYLPYYWKATYESVVMSSTRNFLSKEIAMEDWDSLAKSQCWAWRF